MRRLLLALALLLATPAFAQRAPDAQAPVEKAPAQQAPANAAGYPTIPLLSTSTTILGEKLRYAHAPRYLHESLAGAGLVPILFEAVSCRAEAGIPVPGLLVVLQQA